MSVLEAVTTPGTPPYRRIAWLRVSAAATTRIASGWFFGDFLLITAGHAIDGLAGARVEAWPARRGPLDEPQFGTWITSKVLRGSHGDYAGVVLPQAVGQSVGTFGIDSLGQLLDRRRIEVAGYLIDEPEGVQMHGVGDVTSSTNSTFKYDVLTHEGLSGSPVWLAAAPDYLVGIHHSLNTAIRFSEPMVREMLAWREIGPG